ncbi:MAG: hypothetical protein Q9227_007196 [Pyrenula ochraceoflavens]
MGKIKKAAGAKHETSLSPALSDFIKKATNILVPDLPAHLASFPSRLPLPRGDLYHWIQLLNRFDDILHDVIQYYNLEDGPQIKKFGLGYLASTLTKSSSGAEDELLQRGFSADGDRQLVEAILEFSKVLLEKCGNRNLYASTERLNNLLNTTSISVLNCTLRVALCVAQRYNYRDRKHRSSVLPQYNIDTDRLQTICSEPIANETVPEIPSFNPTWMKSRGHTGADIEFEYSASGLSEETQTANGNISNGTQSQNDTRGPLSHRRSSGGQGSPLRRLTDTNGGPPDGLHRADHGMEKEVKKISIPLRTIQNTPMEEILDANMSKLDRSSRFSLLHRLRIGYGVAKSVDVRCQLLAARILAFSNLAYVYSDARFEMTVVRDELELPRDHQICHQLCSIVHTNPQDQNSLPLYLRTAAATGLRALSRHKNRVPEILAALGVNLSHGVLMLTVRQVVASLSGQTHERDDAAEDEWRESIFSLVDALMFVPPPFRPNEGTPSPGLVTAYVEVLNTRSEKARRYYLKVLEYFDRFCQHAKDALTVLSNSSAFEAVTALLFSEVNQSLECVAEGRGFPQEYRTPSIDYEIPYSHQQLIRCILPFLDKVLGQHGAVADRILRGLIDTPSLLTSLRLIIENGKGFGGHIWAGAIKVLGSFLHNEPTSYAVIAEAGLSRAFLETITGEKLDVPSASQLSASDADHHEAVGTEPQSGTTDVEMTNSDEATSGSQGRTIFASTPVSLPQGIPASTEAISNVAQAFEAICLTSNGFELFQKSSAFRAFFTMFESPAHVKVMRSVDFLPHLGNVFDELVRHHPALKNDVLSSVLLMVARLRFLCQSLSKRSENGPKLWFREGHESLGDVDILKAAITDHDTQGQRCETSLDTAQTDRILDLPTGTKLYIDKDEDQTSAGRFSTVFDDKDTQNIDIDDFVTCAMSFLGGLFENQSLCSNFMEAGGTELVLDFALLPDLTSDLLRDKDKRSPAASLEIAQVIHLMAENKPHLVIPSILEYCLQALRRLERLTIDVKSGAEFYWMPFVKTKFQESDGPSISNKSLRDLGTSHVESLVQLNVIVTIMQEIFSSPLMRTRQSQQPSPFLQVNAADIYVEINSRLGRLQAFCHKEQILMEKTAPESWRSGSRLHDIGRSPEEIEGTPEGPHRDSTPAIPGFEVSDHSHSSAPDRANESRGDSDNLLQDPGFRNFRTLTYLMKYIPRNASKWFHALAQGLVPRRRMEHWQKQNAFNVADSIGTALAYQLEQRCFTLPNEHLSTPACLSAAYEYLDTVLNSIWEVTLGEGRSMIIHHPPNCMTAILMAFRKAGGMRLLSDVGDSLYANDIATDSNTNEFEDAERKKILYQMSQCLNSILSYFDTVSSSKCVVESPQSQTLRTPDRAKPHQFLPGQFALELRIDVLPLTRKIWGDCPDFKQPRDETSSNQMLESIIHILRHILDGENENDALKLVDLKDQSVIPVKPFSLHRERFKALIERGFDKKLAQEALYRCTNSLSAAEEYCKSVTLWFRTSRSPPPSSELEAKTPEIERSPNREDPSILPQPEESAGADQAGAPGASFLLNHPQSTLVVEAADDEDDDDDSESMSDMSMDERSTHRAADAGVSNGTEEAVRAAVVTSTVSTQQQDQGSTFTVESINAEREKIRSDLVDQCLNVLSEHPEATFDLSDLLLSAAKLLSHDEGLAYRETTGQLVISMLTSLQSDLETGDNAVTAGKKTAASAHFLALLIQDKDVYDACIDDLKAAFSLLISFIKSFSPPGNLGEESTHPWIAPVLLIVEKILSDDAEPRQIEWNPPNPDGFIDSESTVSVAGKDIVSLEEKALLFEAILDILTKVGKDNSLALSIGRVLVILTRSRAIATRLAEKQNLQRLFLMVRQLMGVSDERLMSSLMLILRHIVEDDKTLLDIMKSEIVANFEGRSTRPTDTTAYARHMYHLVLRNPDIFVQATCEKVKLSQYDAHTRPQNLILKSDGPTETVNVNKNPFSSSGEDHQNETAMSSDQPSDHNGVQGDESGSLARTKTMDLKKPVVENPDGVIHYLLSELVNYKDVDDTEPQLSTKHSNGDASTPLQNGLAQDSEDLTRELSRAQAPDNQDTSRKSRFKKEDHPKFMYRCFILQCLTELLHSYNRTKIEFINFSRKQDPLTSTPSKPRSTVLNYLLNGLIPLGTLEPGDFVQGKKRLATSEWATRVIVALCSKTGELGTGSTKERYSTTQRIVDNDDEADLSFVRRFVLEHAIKAFQNAASSNEALDSKYSRLSGLAELFQKLLAKPTGPDGTCGTSNSSYKAIGKMMFEKNFIQIIMSNIADIDLSFPGAKRVVKSILKPIEQLTGTALVLSQNSSNLVVPALGQGEQDEISSASSVSEMDHEREETPDLFRHSTLGMVEPPRDESSSDSEDDDEDDDGGYDDDDFGGEMDYEEEIAPPVDDGEVVSDEDPEDMDRGPVEGMPGEVPMDIELVMNDGSLEDSDEDEDEEDEDDDEIDVDDNDADDMDDDGSGDEDVEINDVIEAGEIHGDDENASLGDMGNEETWESEEVGLVEAGGGVSQDLEELLDPAEAPIDGEDPAVGDVQSGLDTLLQIVGDNHPSDSSGRGPWTGERAAELIDDVAVEEDVEYDDDGDDGDEDQNFSEGHFIFDNGDETPWDWENDDTPPMRSHHHHHRHRFPYRFPGPNFIPSILPGDFMRSQGIDSLGRAVRPPPQSRGADDGTNPLLHRTGSAPNVPPTGNGPASMDFFSDVGPSFIDYLSNPGHGGDVFDALMQAVQRGERTVHVSGGGGQFDIRLETGPPPFRGLAGLSSQAPPAAARDIGEDPQRSVSFNPMVTPIRWQEEARLLFGNGFAEKSLLVVNALLKALVPPALEEEKARQTRLEEERKREAEERAEKERAAKEEERKRKEEEEQEAAQRAAEEAAAAEAAAAEPIAQDSSQQEGSEEPQSMQGVQSSEPPPEEQANDAQLTTSTPAPRTYTTIRGREIDITDMSIDAEYLEALPEELREEVIMQQYAEQRHQAAEQGQAPSEINHEFLDALPEDIREELLQQEAQDRRRREREAARRRGAESGGTAQPEEMDVDSFIASLDPALRRSVLADQSDEILQTLAPQFAAEARSMLSRQLNSFGHRLPIGRGAGDLRRGQEAEPSKDTKKQIVQMVDNAGVATILRLMFMPQQGSAKTSLYTVLHNICEHRQTRVDVINTILAILHDGSIDTAAVEKSLSNLSLRAKTPGHKPPPLKRSASLPAGQSPVTDATPLTVVQQCLGALEALNLDNPHVAAAFLRSDTSAQSKVKPKSKGKGKEDKSGKFALNALLGLLDRKMITENPSCIEPLARLLATITQPLQQLLRKDKEQGKLKDGQANKANGDESRGETRPAGDQTGEQNPPGETQEQAPTFTSADVPMADAGVPTEGDRIGDGAQGGREQAAETAGEGPSQAQPEPAESKEAQAPRPKKTFEPPVIPEANLRLVVGVIAARECHAKTFQNTMSTMMNLSLIQGTKNVFGRELVHQAQKLCSTILVDLDGLLPSIRNAQDGLDLHGAAFSKLSGSTSDQYKLLRVLTALDYLYDPRREETNAKYGLEPSADDNMLPSLYENADFGKLWAKVGECLTAIRQKDNMISAATVLQPSIEALMVICKNTSLKETPAFSKGQLTPVLSGNSLDSLFFNFTDEHRRILNDLVRQNPKLMSGSFSVLVKNPKVLDFDNKLSYFRKRIRIRDGRHSQPPLQLNIRRSDAFMDSYRSLYFKNAEEIKYGKLSIRFHGEEGVDAGGVTREWFQVLSRGMFNPNYALFIPVASDRTTFHPNRLSGVNDEHLRFFSFIGRIIGKALYEGRVLDCHFSRAVYKRILGKTVSIKDMETLDLDYYKSLLWMLENDITDIITENFSVETSDFGEKQVVDLIENGRHIPVTEENKQEYVQRVVEYRLIDSVKEQLENFLKGFFDIIPAEVISIFNEQELELLISGLPDIDIDDWKANTEYHTYNASSPQIQWFWRAVRSFDKEEQAKLLQFVTGTSKVPLNGFKELEGMNGFSKFNIHKDYGNKDRLPSSHTCFNQLDLPEYDNYETLRQRLYMAMTTGSEYFGFA